MTNRQIKDIVPKAWAACQKSRSYVQRSVRGANVVTGIYDIYDSLRYLQIRHAKRKATGALTCCLRRDQHDCRRR
jgi:hypothetical protein